jgi:asparaginyl-tRNA synthetase
MDYFDNDKAYLTQSGQLYVEATALALGKVYSFGPTFRAEKSKTRRHLTEFWMVEPEVAFLQLDGLLDLAEAYITHIVITVLTHHRADLKVIGKDIAKLEAVIAIAPATNAAPSSADSAFALSANSPLLSSRSEAEGSAVKSTPNKFPRLSYDEAHAMLEKAFAEGKIEAPHQYGDDFGSPDETYISSQFSKPVMIHRYPAAIKAFYMQPDPIDPTKALCVDVLAPEGYGEIIGGSQRVDSYDLLKSRIEEHGLPLEAFKWYLDLRQYGSVPHAGFGMGIERVVAWICGLDHVRETIPFARTLNRIYP